MYWCAAQLYKQTKIEYLFMRQMTDIQNEPGTLKNIIIAIIIFYTEEGSWWVPHSQVYRFVFEK